MRLVHCHSLGHNAAVRRQEQISPQAVNPDCCVLPKQQTNGRAKKASLTPKTAVGSKNFRFAEAVAVRKRSDFACPINGSHHIYVHADITELVNLQNVNGQAKPYQVKKQPPTY